MNDWKGLEDKVKNLFQEDKAKTIPGSGSTKHEEDVVGISTVIQCKCSSQKNITILAKDLKRLLSAAELQEKIPIFATENNGELLISISDSINLPDFIECIILISQLDKISEELSDCSSLEKFNQIRNFINNNLNHLYSRTIKDIQARMSSIDKKVKSLYDDFTQYDLFEGQV